jgi:rhodanese-related sulfurtransferase
MGVDYSTERLRQRLPAVTVVEALGPSYYGNGHIPGAVNIPGHRVSELAPDLLPERNAAIVVYGASRGSTGVDAVVRQLRALGYRDVSVYADGKEGWAAAGLPLVGESDA